ncbi:MAG: S-layer homology domain-containing protein [Eubacteriales bacterium]
MKIKYLQIMKIFIIIILALGINIHDLLISSALSTNMASGMYNFQKSQVYIPSQFSDVLKNEWYEANIKTVYEYGVMNGVSKMQFSPGSEIKISEILAIAARVRSTYDKDSFVFSIKNGENWYQPYVDYLIEKDIIKSNDFNSNWDKKATRQEFAYVMSRTLPEFEYVEINNIVSIPDVNSNNLYFKNIITLYNAGIIKGVDLIGSFKPYSNITRAEAAAITSRLFLVDLRMSFSFSNEMKAEDVVLKNCVFKWQYPENKYIWTYNLSISKDIYDYFKSLDHVNKPYIYYATQTMDDDYIASLARTFESAGKEKNFNELEKSNLAITFVQSLEYVDDLSSTGLEEYPKFPIETLYDGKGDCEDTSFLLASILKEMNYKAALIVFQDHMGVGIVCDTQTNGTFFTKDSLKYYYVETTGKGFQIGELPEDLSGNTAIVLPL